MRALGGSTGGTPPAANHPAPAEAIADGLMAGFKGDAGPGHGSGASQGASKRATSIPDPAGSAASPQLTRKSSDSTISTLLEPFSAKNGGKIPDSSRAGAEYSKQKNIKSVGLLDSWKYLPFLAHQATSLASAFVSHHVFGPPKKSWGIELTLFTTAIRESVQFSHLSSLDQLRKFLSLGQILPTPRDGVVTPVTFNVKRRNLPGLLQEADAREDGTREISGEWVVSKRIWRRMNQEQHYANANSRRGSAAENAPPQRQQRDKVILFLHGGAYYVMSAATHRYITISVSKYTDCRVFAVNYRLAPECRWPGQIHDAVSAYLRLTLDLKIPPENIIFAGDSAGGGLCCATLMYLRDNGLPLPCGTILMSPWVDLTMSCDSWETNAPYDYLRMPSGDDHMNPIASYLGPENVRKFITDPYVSPLFGDFTGLPPMLIQCGDAECLRDEGTLLAHKASLASVQVFHEVYEDCPHVFQALFFLEASKKAFRSHRHFVRRILPTIGRSSTLDVAPMDKEVMSDAHEIKEDGQPEAESLPTSQDLDLPETGPDAETSFTSYNSSNAGSDGSVEASTSRHHGQHEEQMEDQGLNDGDPLVDTMLSGIGSAIHAATKVSPANNHDLDRASEEQDESIAKSDESMPTSVPLGTSVTFEAGVKPSKSAPSSPSTFKNRHRSLSSLSLTPHIHPASTSTSPITHYFARPSPHGRQHSNSSIATLTPSHQRSAAIPRARANSHPDLQALIASYEKSPAQHTTMLMRGDDPESDSSDSDAEKGGRLQTQQAYGF